MSSTEEITAGIAAIVEEVTGLPADGVQPDEAFTQDLDVDSLSMVEIVVAAEERFGIRIADSEVRDLRTVGDFVAYVEQAARS